MKKMGRRHRHFFRIVAIDSRQPRDGKVIEELGTYDPQVKEPDKSVTLKPDRIRHWLRLGAQPSEHCQAIFRKYLKEGANEGSGTQDAVATEATSEDA